MAMVEKTVPYEVNGRQFEGKLVLTPGESEADAIVGCVEIANKRSSLFGRAPDTAGLNYYVNGIATGQFSLASVALNVYNGAQGDDAG